MNRRHLLIGATALVAVPTFSIARTSTTTSLYLAHPDGRRVLSRLMVPRNAARSGRHPVVVFSHGANSAAHLYDAMLEPICRAGFIVISLDHLDAGGPADPAKLPASGLFRSRVDDLALPLSSKAAIEAVCVSLGASPDWNKVCAMGHSFGAAVAQSLAGATLVHQPDAAARAFPHPGISALIAVSPPGPRAGLVPEEAWESVRLPSIAITGTHDILPGFIDDWRTHIRGMETGSTGNRWKIVGQGVDHYFGGLICRLSQGPKADAQGPALEQTNRLIISFLQQWARGETPRLPAWQMPELHVEQV